MVSVENFKALRLDRPGDSSSPGWEKRTSDMRLRRQGGCSDRDHFDTEERENSKDILEDLRMRVKTQK